jgi:hypothetical protein
MPKGRTKKPVERRTDPDVAARMHALYGELLSRYYREKSEILSYRKFGLIVAKLHPRERFYDQSTIATWIKYGQRPDDGDTQEAIAKAFGVLPGWLWFGSGPKSLTNEGVVIGRSRPKKGRRRSA